MSARSYVCVAGLVAVSAAAWPPGGLSTGATITTQVVFCCGWITALATALGTLPFVLFADLNGERCAGLSNCVAAGMMLAASLELMLVRRPARTDGRIASHVARRPRYQRSGGCRHCINPSFFGSIRESSLVFEGASVS